MTKVFISHANEDSDRVEDLVRSLHQVGFDTWHDSNIKGGQVWWDEILDQIRHCDVFLAVVSPHYIKSTACQLERSYAAALNRHLMPVQVAEYPIQALPVNLQGKQIIDYTTPSGPAAFRLIAALKQFEVGPPLPEVLPPEPPAPFSYLTELTEQVRAPRLEPEDQRQIIERLENGFQSLDPAERAAAQEAISLFAARQDLLAQVEHRITALTASETHQTPQGIPQDPLSRPHLGLDEQRRILDDIERRLVSSPADQQALQRLRQLAGRKDLFAEIERRITPLLSTSRVEAQPSAQDGLENQQRELEAIHHRLQSPRQDERRQALSSLHQFTSRNDLYAESARRAAALAQRFDPRPQPLPPPPPTPTVPTSRRVGRIVMWVAVGLVALWLLGYCVNVLYYGY